MPVAYLGIVAVAVDDDDIEMRGQAFDMLLHVQKQVAGSLRVGLVVPLEEDELRLAMGAVHGDAGRFT